MGNGNILLTENFIKKPNTNCFKMKNKFLFFVLFIFLLESCDEKLIYHKEELVIENEDSIKGFKYNGKLYSGDYERYYNELGLKKIKEKGSFFNGIRSNHWEYYHNNGKLKQKGKYINGVKEGEWIYYFENGRVSNIEHYGKGKEDGLWKKESFCSV